MRRGNAETPGSWLLVLHSIFRTLPVFHGIPIIGIAGGIGSGKSFVARLFGELGCLVIDSDAQVRAAYEQPNVRSAVKALLGDNVFRPDGTVDRRAIARRVFGDTAARQKLEQVLHPAVASLRDRAMHEAVDDQDRGGDTVGFPVAFVWDTPLLFEAGLAASCDAIVFVDTPREERLARVQRTRGWDDAELARREKTQWPLDNKRALSHYVLTNTAGQALSSPEGPGVFPDTSGGADNAAVETLRGQVRQTLSRILEKRSGSCPV